MYYDNLLPLCIYVAVLKRNAKREQILLLRQGGPDFFLVQSPAVRVIAVL